MLADLPGAKRPLLARLTGRRALLGAMVLTVLYAEPLLLTWAIARAAAAGLLGDVRWLPITLALVLGLGLHIALTVKLGAWVQMVQWGEEYMITFPPVSGFLLGWWRFVVQLASFILVVFLAADADEVAKERQMSNPVSEALPDYAQRAPAPEGAEPGLGDDVTQNEYVGRPNATYELSYAVPATFDLADVESYLGDPAWADGVDGGEPIGALQQIECDTIPDVCEAEVTPPGGEPVEYTVETRLNDSYTVTMDNGEDGQLLDVAIEYVEAE
ncbi:hypothetical protein [uncultured Nocardioides sp.]|uniref:hypothetical protein n=1 Tax=uncultured Nocardioides sp. TaxID=198441 RepID=UPI002634A94D|nr:hypothetical protein [uncultured Nocardioides sp.]